MISLLAPRKRLIGILLLSGALLGLIAFLVLKQIVSVDQVSEQVTIAVPVLAQKQDIVRDTGQLQLPIAFTAPVKLKDDQILLAGNWGVYGDNPLLATIISAGVQGLQIAKNGRTEFVEGTKSASVWVGKEYKNLPPAGPLPRGFSLPDGSAILIGGINKQGSVPVVPAQRWDANTGNWSVIPGVHFTCRAEYAEGFPQLEDIVQRANGDLVLFDSTETGRTKVRRWDFKSGKVEDLGALTRWRSRFSVLELTDGRVAVIGGAALAESIALDKDCSNCPDEYTDIGEMQDASSVEVYDFATRKWTSGPNSRYPGDTAVRLADGRIAKVGLKNSGDVMALEVADASLTSWKLASPPPKDFGFFQYKKAIAIGMRVLLLGDSIGPGRSALVWNAESDSWSVVRTDRLLHTDQLLALDGGKLFLLGGRHSEKLTYQTVVVP